MIEQISILTETEMSIKVHCLSGSITGKYKNVSVGFDPSDPEASSVHQKPLCRPGQPAQQPPELPLMQLI